MNLNRARNLQDYKSVLRIQKSTTGKTESDTDKSDTDPKKELSAKARRRLKNIKEKERLRRLRTVAIDNTRVRVRQLRIPTETLENYEEENGLSGTDLMSGAILLYSLSEGATGTIKDFDKILEALKNDTFLSRDFNPKGELRPYKLDKNGMPKYKGGGRGNVKAEDVAKAAKKFKLNANVIKTIKALGQGANVLGLILTTMQAYEDGEISVFECMDIIMGLVAFVPGYGWVISGAWTIMRLTIPEDVEFGIEMDNGIRRFGEW